MERSAWLGLFEIKKKTIFGEGIWHGMAKIKALPKLPEFLAKEGEGDETLSLRDKDVNC